MHRIIGIGGTFLDIIFEDMRPVSPMTAALRAMVSHLWCTQQHEIQHAG